MPYVSPATVVTGTAGASTWGNAVKAATDYLANPPACRVFHNAAQSTTTSVGLALAFNSERFDTDTMHDNVTNNSRITIKTAGLYVVTAHIEFAANATGQRELWIQLNGATIIAVQRVGAAAASTTILSVTTTYKCIVDDYLTAVAVQNSGGALNVTALGNYTPEFAATWIGLG